jgi:serralysin
MTPKSRAFATAACAEWRELANLTFTQVDDSDPTNAVAYLSNAKNGGTYTSPSLDLLDHREIEHEAVRLSAGAWGFPGQQAPNINHTNHGFVTLLHEIGHALGRPHPGPYDAGSGTPLSCAANSEFVQDNRQHTKFIGNGRS